MTNILTNLVLLSLTISTNTVPGRNEFRMMRDRIVGIRSIEYAEQAISIGIQDGTNTIELLSARKLLWSRTNWVDLPIVTGALAKPDGEKE